MPRLDWIGKDKVVNHHQDVPFRVLEHKYGFTLEDGKQTNEINSGNKIIHGDNLEALKSLMPEYEGRIKCIYIDPPYNTGNEKWVYNDNVNHPKIKKWLGEVVGKQGEDLTRHDKWLCMMYPRLKLLHKLLSEDGAIFISIDDNEQANLKLVMDEIFGLNNFVNCISVNMNSLSGVKMTHAINGKRYPAQKEYILLYKKGISSPLFNIERIKKDKWDKEYNLIIPELEPEEFENFQHLTEDEVNGILSEKTLMSLSDFAKRNKITLTDEWKWENSYRIFGTKSNRPLVKKVADETFSQVIVGYKNFDGNMRFFRSDYNKKVRDPRIELVQADANSSVYLSDSWIDISTDGGVAQEGSIIFPNGKKPLKLVERVINAISDKESIILDSFAGSGTTAHAVLNLNKKDKGNRKFILIEMENYADSITAERVKRVIGGYGTGNSEINGTGGSFDYYELGHPVFNEDNSLNEEIGDDKIREYIYYSETKKYLQRVRSQEHKYLLDTFNDTGYYFYYEKDSLTTLSLDTLNIVTEKAEQYLIYADTCLLDKDYMVEKNIIFKKIPRDIRRF
jgi:adenine-specific DNA-methyltransferase|nr:site-specific DNA-methyltransferase [Proteiniphilum sp. UBA4988]